MTAVPAYIDQLWDALCLGSRPLMTRAAQIEESPSPFLEKLATGVLGYLALPTALSTNTRVLDGDREVPRDRWAFSRMGHGQVIHSELRAPYIDRALGRGELLVIDSIDEQDRTIMALREALEYRLGARAWVNAYLTANDQTNFGLHDDTHDTIIIQLLGRKRWLVDSVGRGVAAPELDMGKYELTPGMALVMAGRTAHDVTGFGELTLHLTIGFDHTAALFYHAAEVSRLLARPDTEISEADLVHGKARIEERRTGSSLPYAITGDLADCRLVRWASRLPPVMTIASDGSITVLTMGQEYQFSAELRPVITALLSGLEYGTPQLLALSGLSEERFTAFLRTALDDDLVITSY